ncbi:MAG: UDP-2,3-diacylglucosamine diphosphatase, partial [Proteobacteria bacterium]|nr:UDP-2,3-diacylglucosamine diphosphatase [Pseudomonadota bacterium]
LYLVGDIIDGWELRRKWLWSTQANTVIQKILRMNRKQTRVTYIFGNHDEFMQQFLGLNLGGVRLVERAVHEGMDGRRYLVLHGHQLDGLVLFNRLLERVGSRLYDWILEFNLHLNRLRRRLGFGYWSVAAYLKFQAKGAVRYVTQYEEAMVRMARAAGVEGVICGHIHRAEITPLPQPDGNPARGAGSPGFGFEQDSTVPLRADPEPPIEKRGSAPGVDVDHPDREGRGMGLEALDHAFEGQADEGIEQERHQGTVGRHEANRIDPLDPHLDPGIPLPQQPKIAFGQSREITGNLDPDQPPKPGQNGHGQAPGLATTIIHEGGLSTKLQRQRLQDFEGQAGIHPLVLDGISDAETGFVGLGDHLPGQERRETVPTIKRQFGGQPTQAGGQTLPPHRRQSHCRILSKGPRPPSPKFSDHADHDVRALESNRHQTGDIWESTVHQRCRASPAPNRVPVD